MTLKQAWKTLKSTIVLNNRWLQVLRDTCELPSGVVIPDFYYCTHGDFVRIFAFTNEGQVLLVRQYRYPIREFSLELPAGMISQSESPIAAAQRELLEETGYSSESWSSLGILPVSPGKLASRVHVYMAMHATRSTEPRTDGYEQTELHLVSLSDLDARIAKCELTDATSLAACLLARRALGK